MAAKHRQLHFHYRWKPRAPPSWHVGPSASLHRKTAKQQLSFVSLVNDKPIKKEWAPPTPYFAPLAAVAPLAPLAPLAAAPPAAALLFQASSG
jgi:hypothetical protein